MGKLNKQGAFNLELNELTPKEIIPLLRTMLSKAATLCPCAFAAALVQGKAPLSNRSVRIRSIL